MENKINRWWRPEDEESPDSGGDQGDQQAQPDQGEQPDQGGQGGEQPNQQGGQPPSGGSGGQQGGGQPGGNVPGGGGPTEKITPEMAGEAHHKHIESQRKKQKELLDDARAMGFSTEEAYEAMRGAMRKQGRSHFDRASEFNARLKERGNEYEGRAYYQDEEGDYVRLPADFSGLKTPQQRFKKLVQTQKTAKKLHKEIGTHLDKEYRDDGQEIDPDDELLKSELIQRTLNPNREDSAFDPLSGESIKKVNLHFNMFASKIAEDAVSWPIIGDDEWDMEAIMRRKYDKRPLSHCKQSRERSRLVLVLDSSPSCASRATFFGSIAMAGMQFGDVEIYDAPNAYVEAKLIPGNRGKRGWRYVGKEFSEDWGHTNRTIVFFGDWDGAQRVIHNSQRNNFYWFDCSVGMNSHPYMIEKYHDGRYGYRYSHFKGKRYYCRDATDFIKIIRKVR